MPQLLFKNVQFSLLAFLVGALMFNGVVMAVAACWGMLCLVLYVFV